MRLRTECQLALSPHSQSRVRPEPLRPQLAELLLKHYPQERSEAMGHLDTAIAEFRDMEMHPSWERVLATKEILGA